MATLHVLAVWQATVFANTAQGGGEKQGTGEFPELHLD